MKQIKSLVFGIAVLVSSTIAVQAQDGIPSLLGNSYLGIAPPTGNFLTDPNWKSVYGYDTGRAKTWVLATVASDHTNDQNARAIELAGAGTNYESQVTVQFPNHYIFGTSAVPHTLSFWYKSSFPSSGTMQLYGPNLTSVMSGNTNVWTRKVWTIGATNSTLSYTWLLSPGGNQYATFDIDAVSWTPNYPSDPPVMLGVNSNFYAIHAWSNSITVVWNPAVYSNAYSLWMAGSPTGTFMQLGNPDPHTDSNGFVNVWIPNRGTNRFFVLRKN